MHHENQLINLQFIHRTLLTGNPLAERRGCKDCFFALLNCGFQFLPDASSMRPTLSTETIKETLISNKTEMSRGLRAIFMILFPFFYISENHSYDTRSAQSNDFYTQSSRLRIEVNSFSRIGTKIWNEMPVSFRKLSKNAFKRKIKQTLFEIIASEDCYIVLPEIVQKVNVNLNLFPFY